MDKLTATNNKGTSLPLGPLFKLLSEKGFKINPDDYIEILDIVERTGHTDIDETARKICPVIAYSKSSEEAFFDAVKEYKRTGIADSEEPTSSQRRSPGISSWVKALLSICWLALFAYIAYNLLVQRGGPGNAAMPGLAKSAQKHPGTAMSNAVAPAGDYTINVTGYNKAAPVNKALKPWITISLLSLSALTLLTGLILGKKQKETRAAKEGEPENKKTPNNLLYQIPFARNDLRLINREKDLTQLLSQMRYPAAEAARPGEPGPVQAGRAREYLVLIEGTNPKSMMNRLFHYLADSMAEQGILLTRFSYDHAFICYNKSYPSGLTLEKLYEKYGSSVMLIFGKAHELVYKAYPVLEEQFEKQLHRWKSKAIITPLARGDWQEKERVLGKHFLLLPADIRGLRQLAGGEKPNAFNEQDVSDGDLTRLYKTGYIDFTNVDELSEYLQGDEAVFQWLCAISIYPKLRWEVLVETGRTLLENYGRGESLNYSTLLKLCRIGWMHEGVVPQHTRLELLKRLKIENEIAARQTFLSMLDYTESVYGRGYFFDDEKRRQQITNGFVLYANDKEKFERYREAKDLFREQWERGSLLDAPLKKYLDKADGNAWNTPVNNGKESVSLDEYFKLDVAGKSRRNRRIFAIILSLIVLGTWLSFNYLPVLRKVTPVSSLLYQTDLTQNITLPLKIQKDLNSCGDTADISFDTLSGYLIIGQQEFHLSSYSKKTATATFNIPYSALALGSGKLMLSMGADRSASADIDLQLNRLPASVSVSCNVVRKPDIVQDTLLQTADSISQVTDTVARSEGLLTASLPRSLNEIWQDAGRKYLININLPKDTVFFTDGNKDSYSAYKIGDVFRAPNGDFRVVTQTGDAFRLFIIRNVTPHAFELAVCPDLLKTKEEINALNETSCGTFHVMQYHYYDNNQKRIYLPVNPQELIESEALKFRTIVDSMRNTTKSNTPLKIKAGINENVKYLQPVEQRELATYLSRKALPVTIKFDKERMNDRKNPFVRGYLTINADETPVARPEPDCSRTFTSIDETFRVASPLIVCKLNLSRLALNRIPERLYALSNLRELNLGATGITQNEIENLQKALPNCRIIYTKPPEPVTPNKEVTSSFKSAYKEMADEILGAVNEHRRSIGLGSLKMNNVISEEAETHSKNMAADNVLSHDRVKDRMRIIDLKLGPLIVKGEIVGMGGSDLQEIMEAWLNSPVHRNQIEGKFYNFAGIGIAKASDGTYYYTQIFIAK